MTNEITIANCLMCAFLLQIALLKLKTYKYFPHSKIKSRFYRHEFKHYEVSKQLHDIPFLLCLPSLPIHNIIILLPCGPLNSLMFFFSLLLVHVLTCTIHKKQILISVLCPLLHQQSSILRMGHKCLFCRKV